MRIPVQNALRLFCEKRLIGADGLAFRQRFASGHVRVSIAVRVQAAGRCARR
jgi:hypothetical protein